MAKSGIHPSKKKNCRFVSHQFIIPLMSTESEEGGKENVYSVSEYLGVNEIEKKNVGLSCGSKDRGMIITREYVEI